MKKSFLIHIDSLDVLNDLSDSQCGELFKAIKSYHNGEEIKLSTLINIAFSPFKNQFIRDDEKYQITCERRAIAGSKGGKQKVANASKYKQNVVNLAENKKDNDNKNDNKTNTDQQDADDAFDTFWNAGMRKVNKKKTKPIFNKLVRSSKFNSILQAANFFCLDIKRRINSNQLGFSEMHPTTYLNGERWNDQITQEVQNHGQRNQTKFETTTDRYARQSRELQERENTARGNKQNPIPIPIDGEFIRR